MSVRLEDIKDPVQRKLYADAAGITDPAKTGLLPRSLSAAGYESLRQKVIAGVPMTGSEITALGSGTTLPKPRMNQTETAFFEKLLTRGYDKVQFEGVALELANGARYTPDFYCATLPTSEARLLTIVFYEVKGPFIREAALVRLKVAARQFREFVFILAQKKAGQWTETRIEP